MEQLNGDPNPLVVVISGPSGVGKDTLLERMSEMGSRLPLHRDGNHKSASSG